MFQRSLGFRGKTELGDEFDRLLLKQTSDGHNLRRSAKQKTVQLRLRVSTGTLVGSLCIFSLSFLDLVKLDSPPIIKKFREL
jgi:hypothetical protein